MYTTLAEISSIQPEFCILVLLSYINIKNLQLRVQLTSSTLQIVNGQQFTARDTPIVSHNIILMNSFLLIEAKKITPSALYEDIHGLINLMVKHDEEPSLASWSHYSPHRSVRILQRSLNITVMRKLMSTPI